MSIQRRVFSSAGVAAFGLSLAWVTRPAGAASETTPWPRGKPVPAFALADLEGRLWTLPPLNGAVVVINFWATWCEPCRAEMPALAQLAQAYPPERLVVLTVNYQESAPTIRRFTDSVAPGLPVLRDASGDTTKAWTRRIFPSTVVLDASGRPRLTVTGEYDWTGPAARQLLAPFLAAPAQSAPR